MHLSIIVRSNREENGVYGQSFVTINIRTFMYNIIYEMSRQSRFDAPYWMLGAGALGRPRGMVGEGRWEEGSGWGTRVYLWRIHVDIWQNQYNIVKLKKKKKRERDKEESPGNLPLNTHR